MWVRGFSVGITYECTLEGHEMQVLISSLTRVERILGGHSSEGDIWKVLEMFRKSEGQEAWKKDWPQDSLGVEPDDKEGS